MLIPATVTVLVVVYDVFTSALVTVGKLDTGFGFQSLSVYVIEIYPVLPAVDCPPPADLPPD